MKYCRTCGAKLSNEDVVCINCGCAAEKNQEKDKVPVTAIIFSFLIPGLGLIYWAVQRKKYPNLARVCGIIGVINYICLSIIAFEFVNGDYFNNLCRAFASIFT